MPVEIIVAIIGAAAVITAAIINVLFKQKNNTQNETHTNQYVSIDGNDNDVTQEIKNSKSIKQQADVKGGNNKLNQKND